MVDFRYLVYCSDCDSESELLFGSNDFVLARDFVFDEASDRPADENFSYRVIDTYSDKLVLRIVSYFIKSE